MKKIFVVILILLLCISASNAQAFSLTDTISLTVTSITRFFKGIGNMIGIKSAEKVGKDLTIFGAFDAMNDYWSQKDKINCKTAFEKAGQYADAYDLRWDLKIEIDTKSSGIEDFSAPHIAVPDLTHPIDSGIDPTTSIPKTNPTINPGINQPIDNANTSSIKDLICINIANAEETDDEDEEKDPCKELERDRDAAKKAMNDKSLSSKQRWRAQLAYDNIDKHLKECCEFLVGGGGGGDTLPKDPGIIPPSTVTITIPSPDITLPIDEPPIDTKPPEYVYVCDFTSPSYNNMYNCIVKQGDYTIGDIQCNPNENKPFKEYETVTKKFLGLIPYESIEEKEMFYNPVCVKPEETPPIVEPPITTPTKPEPIGNPDKSTPSTPVKPEPKPPVELDPYCHIRILQFYDKDTNTTWNQDDTYSIFNKPEDGILSKPRLEYIAENCEKCRLEITPTVNEFIDDNPDVFGILKGELMPGHSNRYTFLKLWDTFDNAISLDINNLKPDKYIISLICTGPGGEGQTETLRLNIYPQMRWREVVPVINH